MQIFILPDFIDTFLEEIFIAKTHAMRRWGRRSIFLPIFRKNEILIFKQNFLSSPCVPWHVQRMRRIFLWNARGKEKWCEGQEERTWVRFSLSSTSRPSASQHFAVLVYPEITFRYEAYMGVSSCDCQMRGWWQPRREGEHRRAIIW